MSGGPEVWMERGMSAVMREGFMVFCKLVLDQWGLKAYKSAGGGVGRLRFIVDFKLSCLARIPSLSRCSSHPLGLSRRFSHACTHDLSRSGIRARASAIVVIKAFIARDYDLGVPRCR